MNTDLFIVYMSQLLHLSLANGLLGPKKHYDKITTWPTIHNLDVNDKSATTTEDD